MKIIKNAKIGTRAGRLVISKIYDVWFLPNRFKKVAYCICDCGGFVDVELAQFGNKRSCGCIKKERVHHKSKTKLYGVWNTIKTRCYTKSSRQYVDYGGRGIKMCDGFKNDFLFFEQVMGEKPSKSHSIDRIDNDGNYCCGECPDCVRNNATKNVRWATPAEQSVNKRTNLYVIFRGEKMCLSEAARKSGIPISVVSQRVYKLRWSIEESLTIPVVRGKRYVKIGNIGRNQFSK